MCGIEKVSYILIYIPSRVAVELTSALGVTRDMGASSMFVIDLLFFACITLINIH